VVGIASGPTGGLHQQTEQTLWCPKVTGKQGVIRIDRRHQRDAAKVVSLGDHLGTHQNIHLARMHLGQL
jgi:hypothetical protein